MAGYPNPPAATSASHHVDAPNTLSVPWVILAAVLIATGIFSVAYFMISFQLQYLGGILLTLSGALMLLSPRAGSDHA